MTSFLFVVVEQLFLVQLFETKSQLFSFSFALVFKFSATSVRDCAYAFFFFFHFLLLFMYIFVASGHYFVLNPGPTSNIPSYFYHAMRLIILKALPKSLLWKRALILSIQSAGRRQMDP